MHTGSENISYQHPWLAYKRPQVRDLAYAIACPPILSSVPAELTTAFNANPIELTTTAFWQKHYFRYVPKLNYLERNSRELNCFLAKNYTSLRLGSRFEALLMYWFQDTEYHPFRLIAHNIQLFDAHKTIGELDFILLNTLTNEIEHWEVAVKFFLGEAPFSPAYWKGLKGADNLLKKTTHMLTKSLGYDEVIIGGKTYPINKRVAVIKGRFFIPDHQQREYELAQIDWLNPNLPVGKWFNHIPNFAINQTDEYQWRRGKRVEWLTKRDCYDYFDFRHSQQQQWQTGLYFNELSDNATENAIMLRLSN